MSVLGWGGFSGCQDLSSTSGTCDLENKCGMASGHCSLSLQREAYDPINHNGEAQDDLIVFYEYKDLGCPRLVYYDKPWKPVVEL